MPLFFIQCGLAAVAGQILREIVASDESGGVKNGSANHDSDSHHCVYVYVYTLASGKRARVRSHIGREYLLVLEILLQGDAARHDGCELDVVQTISAARHFNRQSVCKAVLFIAITAEVSPPAARSISAPFMTWSFMVYRVFKLTPFS